MNINMMIHKNINKHILKKLSQNSHYLVLVLITIKRVTSKVIAKVPIWSKRTYQRMLKSEIQSKLKA